MKTRLAQALPALKHALSNEITDYVPDEFLATNPDCPVFGLNLACVYPFPASVETAYTKMAGQLSALDDGVYVYPFWETHVTIMTFLNFSLHQRPSGERLGELRSCIGPVVELIKTLLDNEAIAPFQLEFRPPELTRKAAILQAANDRGEIAQLRRHARQLLEGDKGLHERLTRGGLNAPGIVHSTIMRFKKAPRDLPCFAARFDAVAASTGPLAMTVRELLLTTETKPYMREGEIVHRFPLAGPPHCV